MSLPLSEAPDAARVAARAMVLAAVVYRGLLEEEQDPEPERQRSIAWLYDCGVWPEVEIEEAQLLSTAGGQLTPKAASLAVWASEGLAVLVWALQLRELPEFTSQANPGPLAQTLGFLKPRDKTAIIAPALRPASEVERGLAQYRTLHWRLTEYMLRPQPIYFPDSVANLARGGFHLSLADVPLLDGDLAVDGARLSDLPAQQPLELKGIAAERQRAFQWLMGEERLYTDVQAHT